MRATENRKNLAGAVLSVFLFLWILTAAGCGGVADKPTLRRRAYLVPHGGSEAHRYAPVFVLEADPAECDLIGTPAAKLKDGSEHIYVDPSRPSYYCKKRIFTTERGEYTNFIYRVHFTKVSGLRVNRGRNVGLLCIITVNAREQPVLVTTVHTCGCYLAFVPTTYLPTSAYPKEWTGGRQEVYGESLPRVLAAPESFEPGYRVVIFLQNSTHRVMNVKMQDRGEASWRYSVSQAEFLPMKALESLPLGGKTTSFFRTKGDRNGYVKGAWKPWEALLVGWWTLDFQVGRDKAYGRPEETSKRFYTSLKFWRRRRSDLEHFVSCLRYYGWKL